MRLKIVKLRLWAASSA